MKSKAPFYVVQNQLSPLLCEQIVDALQLREPNRNAEDHPLPLTVKNEDCEEIIFDQLQELVTIFEQYYEGFQYKGTDTIDFTWYTTHCETKFICENSEYLRKKWVQIRERDLTGIIFLSDYNDVPPLDTDYEVYGGKVEFPQHGFGFNPQRGTMIVYPSGPHFINKVAPIHVGDLFIAKFQLASMSPLLYKPKLFPGNYTTWFKEFI